MAMSKACLVRILRTWLLGFNRRLRRHRLFIEILFLDYVVARADTFTRTFYFLAIKNQRRPVTNHFDYKTIGRLGESLSKIVKVSYLLSIHLIDDAGPVGRE